MKIYMTTLMTLITTCLVLFSSTDSLAQKGMKRKFGGGWGMGSKYGRMYDLKTVETITAAVTDVERITPLKGMSYGIHLTVKTEQETISVHLGPAWYIENQDVTIERDDGVVILGSRIDFEGKPAIIAVEVKKGDQTLILRDESGFPVWSGWKRRSSNRD